MTSFELRFRPSVALIQIVRRFVGDFYDRVLGDPDAVSRVALATHELLENAVKYSLDGETSLSIHVDPEDDARRVTIRLSNRATETDVVALREIFDEMTIFPDPFEQYRTAMERTARCTTRSGLGIVRVRAEGEMIMRYTIEGDAVTIVAETRVAPADAQPMRDSAPGRSL